MPQELTKHFGVEQYQDIPRFRSSVTQTCGSFIKWKEKYLEMNCTKTFWQRNRLGETFLFGKFCGHGEETIVTLAHYHPHVGWLTQNRDIIEYRLSHHP